MAVGGDDRDDRVICGERVGGNGSEPGIRFELREIVGQHFDDAVLWRSMCLEA